jgi:TnpA family transposase
VHDQSVLQKAELSNRVARYVILHDREKRAQAVRRNARNTEQLFNPRYRSEASVQKKSSAFRKFPVNRILITEAEFKM